MYRIYVSMYLCIFVSMDLCIYLLVQTPGPKKIQLLRPSTSAVCGTSFPKQPGHTEEVPTVGVKARWLVDMVSEVGNILRVNFCIKWLL